MFIECVRLVNQTSADYFSKSVLCTVKGKNIDGLLFSLFEYICEVFECFCDSNGINQCHFSELSLTLDSLVAAHLQRN